MIQEICDNCKAVIRQCPTSDFVENLKYMPGAQKIKVTIDSPASHIFNERIFCKSCGDEMWATLMRSVKS